MVIFIFLYLVTQGKTNFIHAGTVCLPSVCFDKLLTRLVWVYTFSKKAMHSLLLCLNDFWCLIRAEKVRYARQSTRSDLPQALEDLSSDGKWEDHEVGSEIEGFYDARHGDTRGRGKLNKLSCLTREQADSPWMCLFPFELSIKVLVELNSTTKEKSTNAPINCDEI